MELDTEFRYPNVIDFFGTPLFHLCHFTTIDLHNYATYNNYIENNIKKSNDILSEEINKRLKYNGDECHEEIIDSYSQEIRELGEFYPPMHRKAMVITLYNFFEHQVKTLCAEINKLLPQDMSEQYLKEVCIKRHRKFLRREASFDINQGNLLWKRWEDMLKVEQIRHVLVHSEGEIENQRLERVADDIENYCKQKNGIRLIRHRIIIDEGYVSGLIAEFISLFDLLDRQVNAFIRRYESEHGRYEVPLPLGASRPPL